MENLIFYDENKKYSILSRMNSIIKDENPQHSEILQLIGELVDFAFEYQLDGNLWQKYISYVMLSSENTYSISCELNQAPTGSIRKLAKQDFNILYNLYNYDIKNLDIIFGISLFSSIKNYNADFIPHSIYNKNLNQNINELDSLLQKAFDVDSFTDEVTSFYLQKGTGKFGTHRAFRVLDTDTNSAEISPIINFDPIKFSDLIGYEMQKQKLIDNTRAFIENKNANNCLIFGDAGTGKSSSVRAVLNMFYDQGLRIIEIYKHQLHKLNDVIHQIQNRNYKFILFMDDLSFEDDETEYKYLKAVIEGGLERKPDNLLIYATSNRRHLIRERFSDRQEGHDDVHISDTTQEKLSLSARFGITILFVRPLPGEFQDMVIELARKNDILLSEEQLIEKANRWDMAHGGARTGRTAQQFIDYLLGQR